MARPTDVDDSAFNFIREDGVIGTDSPRASNSGIASEKSSAEVSSSSGIAPEKSFAEALSCAAVHVRKRARAGGREYWRLAAHFYQCRTAEH